MELPMMQKLVRRLLVTLVLGAIASGAHAETVSRIRLMLHPSAGAAGELPTLAARSVAGGADGGVAERGARAPRAIISLCAEEAARGQAGRALRRVIVAQS